LTKKQFLHIIYVVYFTKQKMEKLKKLWLIVLWLFLWINFTYANNYEYANLDITADVLVDWTIKVREIFTTNFHEQKHWIFRTIPLNYKVWNNNFHIDISDINVVWKNYETTKENWEIIIKIWDANKYEYGTVIYPISYTVYWLIRNFSWEWYAELYRNIVWNKFDTSIGKVKATINLPKTYTWFKSSDFLITTDWKSKTVEWFGWKVDRSNWKKIIITYNKKLPAYNWITLAIKFPNNYFEFDHKKQEKLIGNAKNWTIWILKAIKSLSFENNPWLFLTIIFMMFISPFMGVAGEIKRHKNKINLKTGKLKWEFAEKYKVIIQYTPPKWLNSAEVWLLLHRREEIKDLFSLIYKWTAEWLIRIDGDVSYESWKSKINNVYVKKIKEIPETAPEFEKNFFHSFIENDTQYISYYKKDLSKELEMLKEHGINMWRFEKEKRYDKLWLLIFLIITVCCIINPELAILVFWLSVIWTCFYSLEYSWKLQETDKWAELIAHILWYWEFLIACDEQQLKTFLKQDPLYFDKVLPYAVAMWIDTEFLEKIRPIMKEYNITPNWYSWDIDNMDSLLTTTYSAWRNCTYNSDKWFSWWSSFDSGWGGGWFSSGWGWWGWGGGSR